MYSVYNALSSILGSDMTFKETEIYITEGCAMGSQGGLLEVWQFVIVCWSQRIWESCSTDTRHVRDYGCWPGCRCSLDHQRSGHTQLEHTGMLDMTSWPVAFYDSGRFISKRCPGPRWSWLEAVVFWPITFAGILFDLEYSKYTRICLIDFVCFSSSLNRSHKG